MRRDEALQYVGAGWAALVNECFDICDQSGLGYFVTQVKEKFGGLRFYVEFDVPSWDTDTRPLYRQIQAIEARSLHTCEECGAPGTQNEQGWIKTRCPAHTK